MNITEGDAESFNLTPREKQVLEMMSDGFSSKYIAEELCISPRTVEVHTRHLHEKLGLYKKDEFVLLRKKGVIPWIVES